MNWPRAHDYTDCCGQRTLLQPRDLQHLCPVSRNMLEKKHEFTYGAIKKSVWKRGINFPMEPQKKYPAEAAGRGKGVMFGKEALIFLRSQKKVYPVQVPERGKGVLHTRPCAH